MPHGKPISQISPCGFCSNVHVLTIFIILLWVCTWCHKDSLHIVPMLDVNIQNENWTFVRFLEGYAIVKLCTHIETTTLVKNACMNKKWGYGVLYEKEGFWVSFRKHYR